MTRNDVDEFLHLHDIPFRIIEHEAVFTVGEAATTTDGLVPTKCLLLEQRGRDELLLVIARGDVRVDLKHVARLAETKRLQFATLAVLREVFGVEPGAVSIFGQLHNLVGIKREISVAIDKALYDKPEIGFHPNDNTATYYFSIRYLDDLVRELQFDSVTVVDLDVSLRDH